jgi:hypothetical protein
MAYDPYYRVQMMTLSGMRPSRPVSRRTRPKTAAQVEIERVDRQLRVERLDRAYAQRPRRRKSRQTIEREKESRARRVAKILGRPYVSPAQREAARVWRKRGFQRLQSAVLSTW